eukprot:TRINITY_DN3450_c0_g1_i2.p1 TRINITY_DN3450_c0_g1~~TRINITY_DN3450_c0_g1_i2.p1  ORF type:complete len:911 (+),score=169.33 TRINITY_DN3450_c0_g1_i2:375-2735(+)
MPKFTGLNTDEEDETEMAPGQSSDHMCDRAKIRGADHFLVTSKANGKAAALTAFKHAGHTYFIYGSKNVHTICDASASSIRSAGSISPLVSGIADVIHTHIQVVEQKSKLTALIDTLCDYTLCGEYEDGQHIVPREEDPPDISWFALVPKTGAYESLDRFTALTRIRSFGLRTVDFALYPRSKLMEQLMRLRCTPHVEGAVIDFMKHCAGKYEIVETVKFKSVWYVLTRCVREIMKRALSKRHQGGVDEVMQRVAKTIRTRSHDFLHLSERAIHAYIALYRKFVTWFVETGHTGHDINVDGMAHHWYQFIKATKTNDVVLETEVDAAALTSDFDSKPDHGTATVERKEYSSAAVENLRQEEHKEEVPAAATAGDKSPSECVAESPKPQSIPAAQATKLKDVCQLPRLLLLTHGIPGDGKTTRAAFLCDKLHIKGITCVMIEQDQYTGNKEETLHAFAAAAKDDSVRVIVLSRCNSCRKQYGQYVEIARKHRLLIVGLMPEEITSKQMLLACTQAVLTREGHQTMTSTDDESLARYVMVLLSFWAVFAVPRVGVDVDELVTFRTLDRSRMPLPDQAATWLKEYARDVRRKPFAAHVRPLSLLRQALDFGNNDYARYRLDLAEVCALLLEKIGLLLTTPRPLPISNMYVTVPEHVQNELKVQGDGLAQEYGVTTNKWSWQNGRVMLVKKDHAAADSWNWAADRASCGASVRLRVSRVLVDDRGAVVFPLDVSRCDGDGAPFSGSAWVACTGKHVGPRDVCDLLAAQHVGTAREVALSQPLEWQSEVCW